MEEEKIKELFREYDPKLSSSMAFIERLERNLNAVEMIHRKNNAVMKRNKRAVVMAACAGFISGIIFTLFLPYLTDIINSGMGAIADLFGHNDFSGYPYTLSWIIVGAVSVFVAVNTYDIALSLLPSTDERREAPHP